MVYYDTDNDGRFDVLYVDKKDDGTIQGAYRIGLVPPGADVGEAEHPWFRSARDERLGSLPDPFQPELSTFQLWTRAAKTDRHVLVASDRESQVVLMDLDRDTRLAETKDPIVFVKTRTFDAELA